MKKLELKVFLKCGFWMASLFTMNIRCRSSMWYDFSYILCLLFICNIKCNLTSNRFLHKYIWLIFHIDFLIQSWNIFSPTDNMESYRWVILRKSSKDCSLDSVRPFLLSQLPMWRKVAAHFIVFTEKKMDSRFLLTLICYMADLNQITPDNGWNGE